MADQKISALPSSTTPLAGTEVLPIVQSSATKQVSIANLTAGRAVSAASLALTSSPLPATSGGTGQSSAFTTKGVVYASSTTALATGSGLQFDGTKLGIGTTAPDRKLDVEAGNAEAIRLSSGSYLSAGQGPWIGFDGGPFADWNMARIQATRAGTEFQGNLVFYTNNSVTDATAATEKFRVTNDGNFVVGTAGKGIDFSANTNAPGMTSELLNWYEEGTWTPVVVPGAGAITTQTCSGRYTRIGRLVQIQFSIVINDVGTASSVSSISGLPFTSSNTDAQGSSATFEEGVTGLTWTFRVNKANTTFYITRYDNNTTFANNYTWRGSLTYTV